MNDDCAASILRTFVVVGSQWIVCGRSPAPELHWSPIAPTPRGITRTQCSTPNRGMNEAGRESLGMLLTDFLTLSTGDLGKIPTGSAEAPTKSALKKSGVGGDRRPKMCSTCGNRKHHHIGFSEGRMGQSHHMVTWFPSLPSLIPGPLSSRIGLGIFI